MKITKRQLQGIIKEAIFRIGQDNNVYNNKGEMVYTPKLPNSYYPSRYDDGQTPFGNEHGALTEKRMGKGADTVRGKYLRYSPEDSGFSSKSKWNTHDFDEATFKTYIDRALKELGVARDYAREHGEGEWYQLLNAVIGELYEGI